MQIQIRLLKPTDIDDSLAVQASRLYGQLRGESITVTPEWMRELTGFPMTWLVAAEVEGNLAGMVTLSAFPRIAGWTAWIEGLIVDDALRGKGIGRALMLRAITIAKEQGFETLNLSSRPAREAANALYQSLGFALVPTNYRRLTL